jgi:hypothetical protein
LSDSESEAEETRVWIELGRRCGYLRKERAGELDDCYLNPPKNTPSIAVGLDGDEFGIVGASPTIN